MVSGDREENEMRVMVLVKATEDSEAGMKPSAELTEMIEAMGKFNEELAAAGVLLAGDGLTPSPKANAWRSTGRAAR